MAGSRRAPYRLGGARHHSGYARLPSHHSAPHLNGHGQNGYHYGGSGGGFGGALARCLTPDALRRALCAALVVLPWSALLLLFGLHSWRARAGPGLPQANLPGARQCVGWRETYYCHPFAMRFSAGDKGCDDEIIPQISGYCLCDGNVTTARVTCGPKRFTCRQKCAELAYNPTDALVLPTPITCPYEVPYIVDDFLKGMTPAPPEWAINATAENARVAPVWSAVRGAVLAHSIANASAPGVRNSSHDFVREGARVEAATTAFVRRQLAAFMAAAPAYPQGTFSGRGIVTIGGGMRYIIPAWMAVHQLRHLGCRLPIEMWYPPSEWPPPEAVAAFARLGVVSRRMDFEGLNITAFKEPPKARKGAPAPPPPSAAESMARFTFKVAALLLSRFEEIIYLDADNIPLRDPAFLFSGAEYNASRAVLWQDYWANTVAPEAEEMLGVPRRDWFDGSFESGQIVVDKRAHWRGLVTAAWLNSYAGFWYEIFTCFLGKGDKETFAYAMAAARERYHVVTKPPGSLGTTGTSMRCSGRSGLCRDEFTGNTMVQPDPATGAPLFLHSNLHKWDMRLPEKFSLHYQRRWQVLMPGRVPFEDWMRARLGYDLELKAYEWVRMLRCQPWWDSYEEARVALGDRATPELDGFHHLLRGIEMDKLYRAGWTGNYQQLLEGVALRDWRLHVWNRRARPWLAGRGWAKRWSIDDEAPR